MLETHSVDDGNGLGEQGALHSDEGCGASGDAMHAAVNVGGSRNVDDRDESDDSDEDDGVGDRE